MPRLLVAAASFICIFLFTSPLIAGFDEDQKTCNSLDSSVETGIEACTRQIESKKWQGHDLAVSNFNRANFRSAKGDYEGAVADYGEAIRLDPQFGLAYANRARNFIFKGDFDRALADFNQAISFDANAGDYLDRGLIWNRKGEYDRATTDFDRAIKADPKNADAYYHRGVTRSRKNDHERAIADYSEAIRLNSKYLIAYVGRGLAYLAINESNRAISDFDAAIKVDPAFGAAFTGRGLAYEIKGDRTRARADYNAALAQPQKTSFGQWGYDTAQKRLAEIAKAESTAATPAPAASSSEPAGRRDYELTAQIGTKEAWEAYLKQYQTGLYADLARAQLAKLGVATPGDRSADERAQAERDRLEKERLAKAQAEKERIAKEQATREQAEKERVAREQAAREQAEKERIAKEQATREQAEKERIAKEQAEKERIAKEQVEKERLAREQAERERLAKEQAERERVEKERIAKEQAEKERIAKAQAEKERLAREQAERERVDKERLAKEQAEKERIAKEQTEKERLARLQAEKDRIAKEQAEKERLDKERLAREEAERKKAAEAAKLQMANLAPEPSAPRKPSDSLSGGPLVLEIKKELKRVGCYTGDLDEEWRQKQTRTAVRKFVAATHAADTPDDPSMDFLNAIRKTVRVCPLECGAREVEKNGECIAKTCESGYALDEDGDCVRQKEKATSASVRREETPASDEDLGPARRPCGATTCSQARMGCFRHCNMNGGRHCDHCASEYASCMDSGVFNGRRCQLTGLARR